MYINQTDMELLVALSEYGRNVALNLQHHFDTDRDYLNTRLCQLAKAGVLDRIGPSERAGLYELSRTGDRLVRHRDVHTPPMTLAEFEHAIDRQAPGPVVRTNFEDPEKTDLTVSMSMSETVHRFGFDVDTERGIAWLEWFEQGGESYPSCCAELPEDVVEAVDEVGYTIQDS
jgi:hypothetical protein